MVSASQQLIYMDGVSAGSRVLAQYGEVGGYLAVEQRHLLQFCAGQLPEAACVGLCQEGCEPVPVGPSLANPLVGEDLCHGPEF